MAINTPNSDHRYAPVGRCIYCYDENSILTDEHIIPYSLRGLEVLPKASCNTCQKATSSIERIFARNMLNSLRIRENMPTRRKKNRLKLVRIKTAKGNLDMNHKDTLAMRPIIHFPQAGFFQIPPNKNATFVGSKLSIQTCPPQDKKIWDRHKSDNSSFTQVFNIDSVARVYAKICHGYAVAWFGIDRFENWLPSYILGKDKHLSYVVGGSLKSEEKDPRSYQVSWEIHKSLSGYKNVIVLNLRLFAYLGGPWCQVVVGKATDELFDDLKSNVTEKTF